MFNMIRTAFSVALIIGGSVIVIATAWPIMKSVIMVALGCALIWFGAFAFPVTVKPYKRGAR